MEPPDRQCAGCQYATRDATTPPIRHAAGIAQRTTLQANSRYTHVSPLPFPDAFPLLLRNNRLSLQLPLHSLRTSVEMYLSIRAKMDGCLARLQSHTRSGGTEQTGVSLRLQDQDEKYSNGLWRPNDPRNDSAISHEQCETYELQGHEYHAQELPGDEVSSGNDPVYELCSQESQVYELHTPELATYQLQPQELPAETPLDQASIVQSQPNDTQPVSEMDRFEFENIVAILRATISDRDREVARLRQGKKAAEQETQETNRKTATARARAAAREKALRRADTRILELEAEVKTLESANDILYAELRAWKAGAYSASRMEAPKSLLEELVALDELCERHLE